MQNEPLFTVATITAGAAAVLALLVAFGLDLTEGQSTAIMGVVGVAAPLIVAVVARAKVSPKDKLRPPKPAAE